MRLDLVIEFRCRPNRKGGNFSSSMLRSFQSCLLPSLDSARQQTLPACPDVAESCVGEFVWANEAQSQLLSSWAWELKGLGKHWVEKSAFRLHGSKPGSTMSMQASEQSSGYKMLLQSQTATCDALEVCQGPPSPIKERAGKAWQAKGYGKRRH